MWNPSPYDCKCNKTCKIDECLDIKNCSCEKRLFGKLELAWEDEILNKSENSQKKIVFIHTISLVIICLLILVAIFTSSHCYYTRQLLKREYELLWKYLRNSVNKKKF